jgi:hypothetical protein
MLGDCTELHKSSENIFSNFMKIDFERIKNKFNWVFLWNCYSRDSQPETYVMGLNLDASLKCCSHLAKYSLSMSFCMSLSTPYATFQIVSMVKRLRNLH